MKLSRHQVFNLQVRPSVCHTCSQHRHVDTGVTIHWCIASLEYALYGLNNVTISMTEQNVCVTYIDVFVKWLFRYIITVLLFWARLQAGVRMATVCHLTTLVQTKISQQLLNGWQWHFAHDDVDFGDAVTFPVVIPWIWPLRLKENSTCVTH